MDSQQGVRVACLQFAAVTGDVAASIKIADAMLDTAAKEGRLDGLDLLILPEMAFCGYTFKSEAEVPLETAEDGPTTRWCCHTAKRFRCAVACGCARRDAGGVCRNSMRVVGNDGELVTTYDKHFLFATDKTWAQPGDAFMALDANAIPGLEGVRVGLGICMDINPYEFEAPFEEFELANYHKSNDVDLIIFSSNWCSSHPDDDVETRAAGKAPLAGSKEEHLKIIETINYWAVRLEPLIKSDVYFACADRIGTEPIALLGRGGDKDIGDTQYCGCSCVLSLKKPDVLGALGMSNPDVLVVDVPLPRRRS